MSRARGPIKYTCPDIDKCKDSLRSQIGQLGIAIKRFDDYSINDIKEYITDSIKTIDNATDFLEDIRDSNDKLREWGAEQEDRANELDSELWERDKQIEALKEEIESLKSELSNIES